MAELANALNHLSLHHGDARNITADIILPSAAYTEKDQRVRQHQGTRAARRTQVIAGRARGLGHRTRYRTSRHTLPYNNIAAVRARASQSRPQLGETDTVKPAAWADFAAASSAMRRSRRRDNFYAADRPGRADVAYTENVRGRRLRERRAPK